MFNKIYTNQKSKRLCVETIPFCVLVVIFAFFFLVFSALTAVSMFGPNAYTQFSTYDEYKTGFLNSTEYLEGEITNLYAWNYELYFYLKLSPIGDIVSQTGFTKIVTYNSVKILACNEGDEYQTRNKLSSSVSRRVVCNQKEVYCEEQLIFHEMNIKYDNYKVRVLLSDDDPYPKELFNNRVEFSFVVGNSDFGIYELSYRYGFLVLNFFVFFMFLGILFCRQNPKFIRIEQYWTLILLFSLTFFNNPLYILNFVLNWWFFTVVNMLFKVLFLSMFMLSLLVFAHALYATRKETNSFCGFYFWKLCVFVCFYVVTSVSLTYSAFHQNEDPSYIINQSNELLEQAMYAVIVILGVYVINLAYYIARAFSVVDRLKRGKSWKIKIVFCTSVLLVGAAIVLYVAFSYLDIVRDSMVFVTYQYFFNGYVFLLAVFYLPSSKDVKEDKFTVLNTKDDDDHHVE